MDAPLPPAGVVGVVVLVLVVLVEGGVVVVLVLVVLAEAELALRVVVVDWVVVLAVVFTSPPNTTLGITVLLRV